MDQFIKIYSSLDRDNLHKLNVIYSEDIQFIDPVHNIHGLDKLKKYFIELFENIYSCNFHFTHIQHSSDEGNVQWEMTFSHPHIKKGQSVKVSGMSHIRFNAQGKVIYHRDYFDLGSMIYEHIPVLKTVIKIIKRRLSQ